jgi:nucleoside-diphosphate-sugar epimerase
MKTSLVGCTGFVGSNLAHSHEFTHQYNTKNIEQAFGTKPDLLVYSGVPAEMFLANKDPDKDRAVCENAADNIRKINPKRLVLISTIAVLDNPVCADEDSAINESKLTAYGLNRLTLEHAVAEIIPKCHIIRLPALFGQGIKKNFIYDMINFFPAMLNKAKYDDLSEREPIISQNYGLQDSGFYKLTLNSNEHSALKLAFERLGFSALNFTDSRAMFQFYNLANLWEHIETAIEYNIPLLHMAAEPLLASEVYEYVYGRPFVNEISEQPLNYDYRTRYADIFGGANGYIFSKECILSEIKNFVEGYKIIVP